MIGVVGPDPEAGRIAAALDPPVRAGDAEAVVAADPEAVVAVGERAVLDLARAGVGAPVLPVDAGPGLGSVAREDAPDAAARALAGDARTRSHPLLSVRVGDEPVGRAVFDATLATDEPARISEFGVAAAEPLERVRADGVVVATAAGSHGYARAAGGPRVAPGTEVAVVVPIAAFEIRSDRWVVGLDAPLRLTVERDESDVSLSLDDREVGRVPPGRPVEVRADGSIETVVVPSDGP